MGIFKVMPKKNKPRKLDSPPRPFQRAEETFLLIYWLWSKEFSINHIAKEMELSTRTVAGYLRRLRTRIGESAPAYTGRLAGVVHVDAWVYKPRLNLPPPKRSYPPKRPLLLGMLSAEDQLRLFMISSRSRAEIYPLIKMHVERGTKIITNKSKVYTGLRKDGYPDLVQKSPEELMWDWETKKEKPNLYLIWDRIRSEMKAARGVRNINFLPRVREVELRWAFRDLPTVRLFRHVIALMYA